MRGSNQPGPEVACITSIYIPSGNTQSLDHLNFRLARKCSLTVDSKGRGNLTSEQLLAVTLSRSCDFLEPCPPVYKKQAEKRSRNSVSGSENCSEFHISLTFTFWTMKKKKEEEEGEGVGREEEERRGRRGG